jgi:hypothetical protein
MTELRRAWHYFWGWVWEPVFLMNLLSLAPRSCPREIGAGRIPPMSDHLIALSHQIRATGQQMARADILEWANELERLATAGASVPPPQGEPLVTKRIEDPGQPRNDRWTQEEIDEIRRRASERMRKFGLEPTSDQLLRIKEIALAHGWTPSEPLAGWLAQQLGKANA